MILCEFTPDGGTLQRIAMDDIALDYQWFGYIQKFSSFKMTTEYEYGGYVKPSFTDLTLSPDMFVDSWPPVESAAVTLIETDTTRAEGKVIYEGTAKLSDYDRHSIAYKIVDLEDDSVITEATVLTGTLLANITTYCGVSYLDLTVDSTNARAASPTVSHTVEKETPTMDLLSEMCSEFTHTFEIIDGVLYLEDILASVTTIDLTEFDVFPCKYSGAKTDVEPPETKFTPAGADTDTAVANIMLVLEAKIVTINCPIDQTKPKVLDTATLYDESTINPVTSSMKVTSAVYNFDTTKMLLEGFGTIS